MRLSQIVPMQPVSNLAASVAFYEKLGFQVDDRNDEWRWARVSCGDCSIMLDESINSHSGLPRGAVLYLYPDDIGAFHRAVRENGLAVPDLHTTFYGMTEFRIEDPDGNRLWIGQEGPPAAD